MTLQLRPYQQEAVDAVFGYWQSEPGNPLVDLATGCGKSAVAAELVQRLLSGWPDIRIVIATHVGEIISQNYQELLGLWPFAPAGIYSAGLGRRDRSSRILFCGIQTVWNKASEIGQVDVLMIDEAHLVPPKASTMYGQFIAALREANPDMKILGLTATPFRLDSGRLDEGDDRLFDRVVYSYSVGPAIQDGYLAPLSSKPTATGFDLSGVGRLGGDYKQNALQAAVDKEEVTRRAVQEIVAKGADRRSWLCFCAGVEHALHVRDAIREHGITCEAVTGATPKDERRKILEAYKRYEIQCLTNNSVLCLDEQTEILTRQGWVGIDEMTPDHLIAAWADDHSVVFTPPELIVRRDRMPDEKMVSVEGRRSNIRVTANHRMIVAGRYDDWGVMPAGDIVGRKLFVPTSGLAAPCDVRPTVVEATRDQLRRRVNSNALNYRRKGMTPDDARTAALAETERLAGLAPKAPTDLTIAECHFIGFWLGDGTLSPRCEFSQSTVYPIIIDWFDRVLKDCGFSHSRSVKTPPADVQNPYVRWSIARGTGGSQQATDGGYYTVEPYLRKDGSDLLWGLNDEQFAAVLHGFWMADGNHRSGAPWKGTGTSVQGTQKSLYDLLQAIGACRGYRMTINPVPQKNPRHSPQWCLRWRKSSRAQFVRDVPLIENEWRAERVWCVTSSTGRLITRRGGRVTVVGNTTGFNHKGVDLLAFLRPTLSASLYLQMAGRGTRPLYAPGADLSTKEGRLAGIAAGPKPDCLVLDFAGLVRKHGPVDMVEPKRPGKGEGEAPIKQCPECEELVHASVRVCTCCGYEFPPSEEARHAATADITPIMSTAEPVWHAVTGRTFREHPPKSGKPPTVKITYMLGLKAQNEWLCPGHSGFAKAKSDRFWRAHGGALPFPRSADEFLDRAAELAVTAEVQLRPAGKYLDVLAWRAGQPAVMPAPAQAADMLDDAIPF